MRGSGVAAMLALSIVVSHSDDAAASSFCNEVCGYVAYVLVTGGGLTTAAGSQISLLRGQPDSSWGEASLGFAAGNAGVGGVLLIVAGIMAALDDDDAATGLAAWGGIQLSIAVAGLVSGATVVSNVDNSGRGNTVQPRPDMASIVIPF